MIQRFRTTNTTRPNGPTPPGPGRLLPMDELVALRDDPLTGLVTIAGRYGDIFTYPFAFETLYVLNHPEYIKHVLVTNQRNYSKDTFQFNLLSRVAGNGLLSSDGAFWRKQRRLVQPGFHHSRLTRLGPIAVEASQRMIERWEPQIRQGRPLDVEQEMLRVALEILGEALFSNEMAGEASLITKAVIQALDHIVYRARHPFTPPDWVPTRRNLRFRRALQALDDAVTDLLSQRRAARHRPDDLLTMLLEVRDAETGEPMDDIQLRDEIVTLLIAGHETVASALTWSWYLLATHPDEEATLHDELDAQLQGEPPTLGDLDRLPYTRAIFDEAMRLYPPNWIISRRAEMADEIGGYPVEAGALVLASPYLIQRHPDYWTDPHQFDPTRFLPSAPRPDKHTYIPFGAGTRLCIGKHFSLIEGPLVIAAIAQQLRLTALQPQVGVEALVTLRPHDGLWMRPSRR